MTTESIYLPHRLQASKKNFDLCTYEFSRRTTACYEYHLNLFQLFVALFVWLCFLEIKRDETLLTVWNTLFHWLAVCFFKENISFSVKTAHMCIWKIYELFVINLICKFKTIEILILLSNNYISYMYGFLKMLAKNERFITHQVDPLSWIRMWMCLKKPKNMWALCLQPNS